MCNMEYMYMYVYVYVYIEFIVVWSFIVIVFTIFIVVNTVKSIFQAVLSFSFSNGTKLLWKKRALRRVNAEKEV